MSGREAYEEDVRRCPNYPFNGKPRPTWDELELAIQRNWERWPTPRDYKTGEEFT